MTEQEEKKYRRNNDRILMIGTIIGIIIGIIGIVSAVCSSFVAIYITPLDAAVNSHVGKDEVSNMALDSRVTKLEVKFESIQRSLDRIESRLK